MDKTSPRYFTFAALVPFLAISLRFTIATQDSCGETALKNVIQNNYRHYYYLWHASPSSYWYNMTLWGGYMQVAEKDIVAPECFTPRGNLLVLTEKHPALEDITEDILAVQLCSLNKNGICVRTLTGLVRKCNNSLLYALPRFGNTNRYLRKHYVCLDRVYTGLPCTNVISLQPKENLYDNVLTFAHDNQYGWTDAIIEGRQFVFPSLKDKETIFEKCSLSHYFKRHYFLQEPLPRDIGEEPIRLAACYVYKIFRTYLVYKNYFIYVRSCNGKLQFDLTVINDEREFCLIAL